MRLYLSTSKVKHRFRGIVIFVVFSTMFESAKYSWSVLGLPFVLQDCFLARLFSSPYAHARLVCVTCALCFFLWVETRAGAAQ
jgi:hypothetical protein